MLTVNIDIQDCLIDGQTGNINHIEFVQGSVCKVYVKFANEKTGLKAIRPSYLGRQDSNIERIYISIHQVHSISCNIYYL